MTVYRAKLLQSKFEKTLFLDEMMISRKTSVQSRSDGHGGWLPGTPILLGPYKCAYYSFTGLRGGNEYPVGPATTGGDEQSAITYGNVICPDPADLLEPSDPHGPDELIITLNATGEVIRAQVIVVERQGGVWGRRIQVKELRPT